MIAIEPGRRFRYAPESYSTQGFGDYYPVGIYPRRPTPFLGNGLGYGFGNGAGEWIRKHWDTLLIIIGVVFAGTGVIGRLLKEQTKEKIDKAIPKTEKMTEQEFQTVIDNVHARFPNRNRQEVETTLRSLLGERVLPAPTVTEKEGMPTWAWLAIGGGALYLLMQMQKKES